MEFLREYNFTDNDIMEIINSNHKAMVDYFVHNKDNVVQVINYFIEIGVLLNKDMFKYRLDIFSRDIDNIKDNIAMYNVSIFVELINDDISNFELLD